MNARPRSTVPITIRASRGESKASSTTLAPAHARGSRPGAFLPSFIHPSMSGHLRAMCFHRSTTCAQCGALMDGDAGTLVHVDRWDGEQAGERGVVVVGPANLEEPADDAVPVRARLGRAGRC